MFDLRGAIARHAAVVAAAERSFEHQGPSPLDYSDSSWMHPDRLAMVDPAAGEHPKGDTYFAERRRTTMVGPSGRRLKKPRTEVTPGAAPGTVAFVDYSKPRSDAVYIHYMKTRRDYGGQGHAKALIEELVRRNPEAKTVDFGKMMNEQSHAVMRHIQQTFPDHHVRGKVYY